PHFRSPVSGGKGADRRPNHVPRLRPAPSRRRRKPGDGPPFSTPRATSGSPTSRFLSNRICRWLHHIHPIRRHHTPHTHLRNRPSCLVQLKIARDAPRLLGFPT